MWINKRTSTSGASTRLLWPSTPPRMRFSAVVLGLMVRLCACACVWMISDRFGRGPRPSNYLIKACPKRTHWSDAPVSSTAAAPARAVLPLPLPLLPPPKGVECPWPSTMSPPVVGAEPADAAAATETAAARAGAGALTAVRLMVRDGAGGGGAAVCPCCLASSMLAPCVVRELGTRKSRGGLCAVLGRRSGVIEFDC